MEQNQEQYLSDDRVRILEGKYANTLGTVVNGDEEGKQEFIAVHPDTCQDAGNWKWFSREHICKVK